MNKECLYMELDFIPSTTTSALVFMFMEMTVLDHLVPENVEEPSLH